MAKEVSFYSSQQIKQLTEPKENLKRIALRFACDDCSTLQIHEKPFVVFDLLEAIKEINEEEVRNAYKEVSDSRSEKAIEEIKMSGENIGKVILREIG